MKTMARTEKTCTAASVAASAGEFLAEHQFASVQDLKLEFRQVPLQIVLNYLSDAAGVVITAQPNVPLNRAVDLWRDELVDSQEAISLLRRSLGKQDCAVLQ